MPNDFTIDPGQNSPPRNGPPRSGAESVAWLVAVALLVAIAVAGIVGWRFYSTAVAQAERAAQVAMREAELARAEAIRQRHFADEQLREETLRADQAMAQARRETVVDEADAELLWVSPTAGPPISLAYAPAGTQCLVLLHPALLTAHPEGEKVLAALGPWGLGAVDAMRSLTGAEFAELDTALVAILVDDRGELTTSVRAQLFEPWDDAELARRWPDAAMRQHGEQAYHVAGERAVFLPPDADAQRGRTLVACPAALVEELLDSAGKPPFLSRHLESLVATTDADRAATLLVVPHFLDAGGSGLLTGAAAPLEAALTEFVDGGAAAVAVSAHWDNNFFVELRAAPALNVSPRGLAAQLHRRVDALPAAMDDMILAQAWPPYGRRVIARLPGMLRQLAATTRRGEADKHAVLRAYLPAIAGHNLLMGAELLLSQRDAASGEHDHADVGMARSPQTVDERLAAVTSLSFTKDTLQRALELLAEDLGMPIEIEGNELRTEGITQNQTLEIDLRGRPAGEILVEILRLANPDRTAESPADVRQKLVYVVRTEGAPGARIIVTTRAAAERRGWELPAAFGGWAE